MPLPTTSTSTSDEKLTSGLSKTRGPSSSEAAGASGDGTAPDEIGNYTNRSPWPTLHLIREASIDRAVESMPDTDEIWKRNVATMEALGYDGWNALWNDDPEGAH